MARREELVQDTSLLAGLGFGHTYQDPTAEPMELSPVTEPTIDAHEGALVMRYPDGSMQPATPEQAAHYTGFQAQSSAAQPGPDGFTVTQDLPSRGRISATVSVNFDAHGNPALLPDARQLGVAMLGAAGSLAQQGHVEYDVPGWDEAGMANAGHAQAGNHHVPRAEDHAPFAAPIPPVAEFNNPLDWQQSPQARQEPAPIDFTSRQQERQAKQYAKKAAKAAGREIGGRIASNPTKALRLFLGAVIFTTGYNAISGKFNTDMTHNALMYPAVAKNIPSDLVWFAGKIMSFKH